MGTLTDFPERLWLNRYQVEGVITPKGRELPALLLRPQPCTSRPANMSWISGCLLSTGGHIQGDMVSGYMHGLWQA